MEAIQNFKPIDPTKIRSPSVQKKKSPSVATYSSRGLNILNLVRRNNLSPRNIANIVNSQKTKCLETVTPEKSEKISNEKKAYFTFSDKKHNPNASPSNSILSKRKLEQSASPLSAKRKRVGFSDPVSTTKEYLIEEAAELNVSSARCLVYEDEQQSDEVQIKVENLTDDEETQENSTVESTTPEPENETETETETVEMETESTSPPQQQENGLVFKDKNELLDYVKRNLTIDEVLDKLAQVEDTEALKRKEILQKVTDKIPFREMFEQYLFGESSAAHCGLERLTSQQSSLISTFVSDVSKIMACNNAVKYKVLDILSEKHPTEFLDHALQENSANKVCEKISMKNIVNYLIHKIHVEDSNENQGLVNDLSKELILHLVDNTSQCTKNLTKDEINNILLHLFKHRVKIDIFDILSEFLRTLL